MPALTRATPTHIIAVAALALAIAGACVLAARRLAGGFSAPDSALPALVAGTALAAMAWLLARALRYLVEQASRRIVPHHLAPAGVAAISHLPAIIVALALLPARPGIAFAALAVAWAITGSGTYRRLEGNAIIPAVRQWLDRMRRRPAFAPVDAELAADFEEDPGLAQWLRRRGIGGVEMIEGGLRISFHPGQKQAAAHVPFVPPLSAPPEVDCVADDSSLRLKVTAAYTYGIRLEARRNTACDEPATALVTFTARQEPRAK